MRRTLIALALPALLLIAAPALAQDAVVEAGRAAGTVGEQADGYLGVRGGDADLKRRVDAVNIQRRAIYTDTASAKPGVTVADVGGAAACVQFRGRVAPGHWYRDEGGAWQQRSGSAAVRLPSFCG